VTPAAVEAEFAVMNVVRLMTVGASASEPRLSGEWSPVTGVAMHFEMRTLQCEVCLPVVIKLPLQPIDRVVAECAILRESIGVRVAVAMAFSTLGGCVAENMGFVACVALLVSVRAEQRKARQAMIEEDLVRPGILVVAVEAAGALRTVVRVVFFVARETVCLRLDLEDRLQVARFTLDQFVRTVQHVFRIDIMVEMNSRPRVSGMAGFAGATEVAVMVVVFQVAGYARDVHLVVERILAVAVVAG